MIYPVAAMPKARIAKSRATDARKGRRVNPLRPDAMVRMPRDLLTEGAGTLSRDNLRGEPQ